MDKKAHAFEFVSFNLNASEHKAEFLFRVHFNDSTFEDFMEALTFPKSVLSDVSDNRTVNRMLSDVHLALGFSYYKMYCPKDMIVSTNKLNQVEAKFWTTVYTKGLGQFFYENKIDFKGLINFPVFPEACKDKPASITLNHNKVLVAFGGGKDSLLTHRYLSKDASFAIAEYSLKRSEALDYIANKNNLNHLVVERSPDPKLFEYSKRETVLNGHVPITVINSFVGILTAMLCGYGTIIFSNEASSNYGNAQYLGAVINHQWGKTSEFERMFQDHIKNSLNVDIEYFSLIRPLHEIEIMRRFVEEQIDLSSFTSCNRNFKFTSTLDMNNLWCGLCPKCVFTFLLLSAFTSKEKLVSIFKKNLYSDPSLIQLFKDILGIGAMKPFECVGTPEETIVAMNMAYKKQEYRDDVIMKMFESEIISKNPDIKKLEKKVFAYGDDSLISARFKKLLS
ncbi:hypothetical protein A2690_02410 [Candidatus Roizmanbacteria bacterium RIFCSPHIGHO2_01_FULL_39_12b]|uniref:UDP-N-acetyl-alpha-D-muramoyl-L-alanyl-L-glutamate epimerase n=1 Tax=Candidatus Roizmanbacteria bacterium RIFCSPHIGHO2_01_FULL_39_12b TaxID=1802030 RepID=A0A1F7GDE9_9BACT|nr:MAG: hypothetical protein A2690_02410 [Candidatus Roizmanbacteria bacterium RIFCSPHIGHO2_01_FULL_39_12b]OGK46649.1 MAG: hypothetical protein A3B46_00390 [Candidatus Roizmanbacteria bacterium RIFCSPLOWO2_01_FULL_39_19]